ncbi:TonB-dependent receptor plug domain-containing protein [Cognaticolwellia mytili]|uniref:TonB-dependent receptor plug domain-containing protein n=1 Tax=Cognaticolwellia mytili TaxID=1888913 RepID=UPI0013020189|nr:TonB-dependent receptor [Cognaticolwellia mytili]
MPVTYAVAADDESNIIPDEYITVTATRTQRRFMESPVAISTVSAEDIQRSSADSVADALQDIPGIQIADAAIPGMKRITLRGESSLRVAILIDGQEITDHSTYGAPLLLDTSVVERIEVIRGTSSVLYGGKALGGVVNIITKKGGTEAIQASTSFGYNSATNGQQLAATVYGNIAGYDYRIALSDNDHEDRDTPDGKTDSTSFTNNSQMFYLAKEFDDHTLGFTYDKFNLDSEIATGMPNFTLDMPQRDRKKLSAFYQYENDGDILKKIKIDAYKQRIDRNFVQHIENSIPLPPPKAMKVIVDTDIQEQLDTLGVNTQVDLELTDNHYTIFGLQFTQDDLNKATDSQVQRIISIPSVPDILAKEQKFSVEDATLKTKAIYLQDEWRVAEPLIVTAGLRHYWVDANLNATSKEGLSPTKNENTKLIGSLAANYMLDQNSNLRVAYSQGYHYPTLLQIATGATAAGNYINPNADLKPETSDNIELGYRLSASDWRLDSTLFYTDASNYITSRDCNTTSLACINEEDKIFINADKAETIGLELSVDYQLTEQVMPYINMTWLSREETYDSFITKDTGTPSLYGKVGVKLNGESELFTSYYMDAYIRAASSADIAYVDAPSEIFQSWQTLNLAFGAVLDDQEQYQVNVELSNILDEKYTPATQSLLAPGRAVMVKFSADF